MSQQAKSAMTVAEAAEVKSFGRPDEVREFPKGRLELIKIGGATIGRAVFEPVERMGNESGTAAVFLGNGLKSG